MSYAMYEKIKYSKLVIYPKSVHWNFDISANKIMIYLSHKPLQTYLALDTLP